jgi:hypothetical protein
MDTDYFFYMKPLKPGPYALDDIGDTPAPLGSGDELKARVAQVLPALAWTESPHAPGTWFGSGDGEFQFTVEPDGQVLSFMGSRLERRQVWRLVRELDLIALDVQHDVVFG